jgi:hypothetical protein
MKLFAYAAVKASFVRKGAAFESFGLIAPLIFSKEIGGESYDAEWRDNNCFLIQNKTLTIILDKG